MVYLFHLLQLLEGNPAATANFLAGVLDVCAADEYDLLDGWHLPWDDRASALDLGASGSTSSLPN